MKIKNKVLEASMYFLPLKKLRYNILFESGSESYRARSLKLHDTPYTQPTKRQTLITVPQITEEDLMRSYFSFFKQIRLVLEPLVNSNEIDLVFGGSLGSLDFIDGWSDTDIVIIIKNFKRIDYINKILFRCSKYLYLNDPLQHHGFIILTIDDFKSAKRKFPIEVLSLGRCFKREAKYLITPSNNQVLLNYSLNLISNQLFNKKKDWYLIKETLHHINLFPCHFYRKKGLILGKKEAIRKICIDYPDIFDCYQKTSRLRFHWPVFKYAKLINSSNILFLRLIKRFLCNAEKKVNTHICKEYTAILIDFNEFTSKILRQNGQDKNV